MEDLPGAVSEEVFFPEQVFVLSDEEDRVHVLCYAGELPSGDYAMLKHVVLSSEHAGVFQAPSQLRLEGLGDPGA